MVDLKTHHRVNEYTKAATTVGMAEGQSASVLVALQFATQGMLEMLNSTDELRSEAVEYYLTLKRLRETIDTELREIDAALELAEKKVIWT